jgi:DNA-binding beta-propeller fold protein YncE
MAGRAGSGSAALSAGRTWGAADTWTYENNSEYHRRFWRNGTLYVADTLTNTVSAIPQALNRTTSIAATAVTLSAGGALDAPLGMTLAPNGDLVVVNGNNGNAVEITPAGQQLTTRTLVKNGAGDLFGVIATQTGNGIFVVNDGTKRDRSLPPLNDRGPGRVRCL